MIIYMCEVYDSGDVRVSLAIRALRDEFDLLPLSLRRDAVGDAIDYESWLAGRVTAMGLAHEDEQRALQAGATRIVYRFAYE